MTIAEQQGTTVTLSHRSEAFSRAKRKNRERTAAATAAGRVRAPLQSKVRKIEPAEVEIETPGTTVRVPNDAVIVNAGGVLPTEFLKSIGIGVETKYGTR